MSRQTSMIFFEATDRQIEALKELGFGSQSDILRIAVDRMYQQEKHRLAEQERAEPVPAETAQTGE